MTELNLIDIIIGFIGGGGLMTIITIKASRKKAEADADATVTDNYEKFTTRLEARLNQTEEKVDNLTEQNRLQYRAIMAAFGCKLHSNAPGTTCPVQEVYEKHNDKDETL